MKENGDVSRRNTVLVVIMALGTFLRLVHLGRQSFWWDEAYSANLAAKSLGTVASRFGQTPTLYHVLLHFWAHLGRSDTALRLLSVAFGVAALYVVYVLGKSIFDARHGLFCAFLLALSPFHLWYSQETRMYTLLILLTTASVLFFLRFLRRQGKWSAVWWILITGLAIYTHYYAVFILFFQVIFFLINSQTYRSLRIRFGLSLTALIMMGIPILVRVFLAPSFSEIMAEGAGGNPFRPFSLPYTFFAFSLGFSYGPSLAELHQSISLATIRPYLLLLIPPAIVFVIAFASGLRSFWRQREKERMVFLLLYLLIPLVSASVLSLRWSQISYNARYVSVSFPAFVLILSHGLLSLGKRVFRWPLILLVVGFMSVSIWNYYFMAKYAKEDYRSAAQFISKYSREGDVILVTHLMPFNYYYRGPLPARSFFWSPTFYRSIPEIQLREYRRAWFVLSREWGSDPDGIVSNYMRKNYPAVRETTFANLSLSLFDLGGREIP